MAKTNKTNPNLKHHGSCHVCGASCKLSFEHIPPKATGNTGRSRVYSGVDIIKKQGFAPIQTLNGSKFDQMQQGSGVYSICPSCNNYFGANYVKVFSEALNETRGLFAKGLPKQRVNATILETDKMHVLAFFKHVISSFCATTQFGTMTDCKEFLLDRESNAFPKHYKLTMFAVPDIYAKGLRTGWTTALMEAGGSYQAAHLVTPPLGFTLYDLDRSNTDIPYAGCDITDFAASAWSAYLTFALNCLTRKGAPSYLSSFASHNRLVAQRGDRSLGYRNPNVASHYRRLFTSIASLPRLLLLGASLWRSLAF